MPPFLRPRLPLPLLNLNLNLTTSRFSSTFSSRPSPPKLPAAQQAEFERLQRAAAVSSAFQEPTQTPPSTESPRHTTTASASASAVKTDDATTLNQGLFRGAPPEFEGDTNPKTGEVGGPKNEPLRWGGNGDWSYNGRVTDF
ncbi:uncharacterized protein TRIVIDRAFT_216699 [Trichoderma virens Gv29-8]|uniref:Succinate dehydrogenase assembly factor 4, mitochondrial n=1 Tax=Hypocrea virens (strain Gv29-8 / FGSC 10586) TaxID=413071 RepID=G9N4E5_HYPVG|nr:uncharacterized protein TRIVIDRAFT_216699 [Trichoderma virens Gv29-8]EHK18470.1 hypothetical protein TRIVIDRAFT_216699 [Trichoderma virens Gv29-8]UKZ52679.1 hypothetical protein TrVGV298_006460 [Trichoderma virens]